MQSTEMFYKTCIYLPQWNATLWIFKSLDIIQRPWQNVGFIPNQKCYHHSRLLVHYERFGTVAWTSGKEHQHNARPKDHIKNMHTATDCTERPNQQNMRKPKRQRFRMLCTEGVCTPDVIPMASTTRACVGEDRAKMGVGCFGPWWVQRIGPWRVWLIIKFFLTWTT